MSLFFDIILLLSLFVLSLVKLGAGDLHEPHDWMCPYPSFSSWPIMCCRSRKHKSKACFLLIHHHKLTFHAAMHVHWSVLGALGDSCSTATTSCLYIDGE